MSKPHLRLIRGGKDNASDRASTEPHVRVVAVHIVHIPRHYRGSDHQRYARFSETSFEVHMSDGTTFSGPGYALRDLVPGGKHDILKHANAGRRTAGKPLIK